MEQTGTAGVLMVVAQLLRHCTRSIHSALFYGGLLAGAIAFPLYAIVLLRRHMQASMDKVLTELAERDPWLWAAVRGRRFFETEQPFEWLEDLCRWQKRYRGIRVVFGSPDLEAKCLHVTGALLQVLLSWSREFESLSPERRARLDALLEQVHGASAEALVTRLRRLLATRVDPLAWLGELAEEAEGIDTWSAFLRSTGMSRDLSPIQAADEAADDRETVALALFLLSREAFPFQEETKAFLRQCHTRSHDVVRNAALCVDQHLERHGTFVAVVRDVTEGGAQSARFESHPDYRKFVHAFGQSPFTFLGTSADEPVPVIREQFRQQLAQARSAARTGEDGAFERAKTLQIAWGTVCYLQKAGLLQQA